MCYTIFQEITDRFVDEIAKRLSILLKIEGNLDESDFDDRDCVEFVDNGCHSTGTGDTRTKIGSGVRSHT